jgi:hypothetical protein
VEVNKASLVTLSGNNGNLNLGSELFLWRSILFTKKGFALVGQRNIAFILLSAQTFFILFNYIIHAGVIILRIDKNINNKGFIRRVASP